MRFAIATADRYEGVLEAFLSAGWEPLKLFTVPLNNITDHNAATIARAHELGMEIQLSPLTERDLRALAERGCDALVVASYDWRIGPWRDHLRYAVNFHPSPLPEGRGPYPQVRAILENRTHWSITCHKLEREFDRGDLLASERFPLCADECHESLDIKLQLAAGRLAAKIASDLPELWEWATPQGEGSYWPRWTEEQRTIDFSRSVEEILRHVRAFGLLESLVRTSASVIYVRRAVGWTERHGYAPGTVVYRNPPRTLVMAARDGYIGLVEWSIVAPEAVNTLGR